jgi:hypothetical protein
MPVNPGMYYFIDSDGDEQSLKATSWDDAEIALLKALPPGITIKRLKFVPDPVITSPKPADIKQTKPGPAGTRVGRRKAYGRNDKCPCGSGKKVKHCCARKR